MTTLSQPAPTIHARHVPRAATWLSLLPLPLWLSCFVLLVGFNALGTENVNDRSPADQAAYYQQFHGGAAAAWAFVGLGIVAILVAGVAVLMLASGPGPRPVLVRAVAVVATVVGLASSVPLLWLLGTDPSQLPRWVEAVSPSVSLVLNTAAFAGLTLAVALAAVVLRGSGTLGRSGKVLTIVGLVASALSLAVPVPMFYAALLFALGVVLLRSASDR